MSVLVTFGGAPHEIIVQKVTRWPSLQEYNDIAAIEQSNWQHDLKFDRIFGKEGGSMMPSTTVTCSCAALWA
jgi:hypothetical protein